LAEARNLRDLGNFRYAELKFREAQSQDNSLMTSIEVASMFLEQGCVKKCRDELARGRETAKDEILDQLSLALWRILDAFTSACVTLCFAEPIQTGIALYEAHLTDLHNEGQAYDKKKVRKDSSHAANYAEPDF
jgi:hypothetical protein